MLAVVDHSETDAGPKTAPGSERLCVVSRKVRPVDELIRFVVAPDGSVVPDLKHKLPGRGVWVTATRKDLTEAVKRKVFARGFKQDVKSGPELVTSTEKLLERAALDALAMAGKAHMAVHGFAKVESAIVDGKVIALLHASDAAPDGVRKMNNALRRELEEKADTVAIVTGFPSVQLDLALGRTNVVHAALLAGPASRTFLVRSARLAGFRLGNPGYSDVAGVPANRDA
jgi:predicted RNA-binding protein YlxR (DUF448 family)